MNEAIILNAILDGAPLDKVAGKELKFRRDVVENYLQSINEPLDVHFNIEGTFEFNEQIYIFFGEDEIAENQD